MRWRTVVREDFTRCVAASGLTQRELAELAGVSRSMIKYVMAGNSQPSDRIAAKLATALGCDVNDFSVPKDEPTKDAA